MSTGQRKGAPREPCDPRDVALKSSFLGPQAENAAWLVGRLTSVLARTAEWRRGLFPDDGVAITEADQETAEYRERRDDMTVKLGELLGRFEGEIPKFSPRYVGHMFSEISLPALLGHFVALMHNPNNISGESSRVGVAIEDEAIAALARMLALPPSTTGHFTSGGTIANWEALIRARARAGSGRKPVVIAPYNAHYSWKKGVSTLGLGQEALWSVKLDRRGALDVEHLRETLDRADAEGCTVLCVVSVAGSTELGVFDQSERVQELLDARRAAGGARIWHHVDAAFGGFFATLLAGGAGGQEEGGALPASASSALAAISRADSVTLDPHKLGYVPYACGTILVKDPADYALGACDAPYIQYEGADRGRFSLEGSRPATGASATWMIAQTIGLHAEGYGRILARTIASRVRLAALLAEAPASAVLVVPEADTNILCLAVRPKGRATLSRANQASARLFARLSPSAGGPFIVSKTTLAATAYGALIDDVAKRWGLEVDCGELLLIRMCLLNPFFGSKEMARSFPEDLAQTLTSLAEVCRDHD